MRKQNAPLIPAVALLAFLAMWLDHGFFASPESYGELQTPTYAAHGFLFAAYIAAIGLRAPVAKWKTLALAAAGASFGLWSSPVVTFALQLNQRDDFIGETFRSLDNLNNAAGTGALITGIIASGALMAAVLGLYTRSKLVASWVLGETTLAAALAVLGWSGSTSGVLTLALIDLSGVLWHTSTCIALATWRSQKSAPPPSAPARDAG